MEKAMSINAINGIHKFIYYINNVTIVLWTNPYTNESIFIPDVIAKANWSCSIDHIYSKWSSYNYDFIRLYCELDSHNQIAMSEYIVENYNGVRDIV